MKVDKTTLQNQNQLFFPVHVTFMFTTDKVWKFERYAFSNLIDKETKIKIKKQKNHKKKQKKQIN